MARFGIYFCSFGDQKPKMSSKIDAKIGIEKNRFRRRPTVKKGSDLEARRGVRGEPLGSEERKRRRKEERKKERKE